MKIESNRNFLFLLIPLIAISFFADSNSLHATTITSTQDGDWSDVSTWGLNFITEWGENGTDLGQFSSPNKITLDSVGNVYIPEDGNRRIQKFDSDGNFIEMYGWGVLDGSDEYQICTLADGTCLAGSMGDGDGQFFNPQDIAFDSFGNFYVVEASNHRIQKFDSSGTFITKWGEEGTDIGQFESPSGIAFDSSDDIYVADTSNHRIQKFDSDGNFIEMYGWGVLDGSDEYQICTLADGSCQTGSVGDGDGEFDYAADLTLDSLGNIYVVDESNYRIQKFDSSGTFITKWGEGGTDDGQFGDPLSIALDSFGNVYVGDYENNNIQKFDSSGTFLAKLGTEGDGEGQFINGPTGVFITDLGFIYAVDQNERAQKLIIGIPTSSDNATISNLVHLTSDSSIHDLTITGGGEFYLDSSTLTVSGDWSKDGTLVSNTGTVVFTGSSNQINGENTFYNLTKNANTTSSLTFEKGQTTTISHNTSLTGTSGHLLSLSAGSSDRPPEFELDWGELAEGNLGFNSPQGIKIDSSGNIYISDTNNNRIIKLDGDHNLIWVIGWGVIDDSEEFQICTSDCHNGINGSGDGEFDGQLSITTDTSGNIYVADLNNHRIQKFDSDGNYLSQFGSQGSGDGEFQDLGGIYLDLTNNIYVADTGNNRIQKFDSDGNYLSQFGSSGSGDGEFDNPYGINIDSLNNIYVADSGNDRIQKFDEGSNYLLQFGTFGTGDGEFRGPADIIIDPSDNIYVVDENNYRIQKFDGGGNYLSQFGSEGSDDGEFENPHGINLDSSGNIYVTDRNNNRIQIFGSSGTFISKITSLPPSPGIFSSPFGLTTDSEGNVYVSDCGESGYSSIQKFDSEGNFINRFGHDGEDKGGLSCPVFLSTDSSDSIYVPDEDNIRINEFSSDGDFIKMFGWGVLDGGDEFQICTEADPSCQTGNSGSGAGQFNNIGGVDIDSDNNIYIADQSNQRIQKFDSDGNFLLTYGWGVLDGSDEFQICTADDGSCQEGIDGDGAGAFSQPSNVMVDSSDNVYVADAGNNRIQKFDSDGNFIEMYGWGVLDGEDEFEICTAANADECTSGTLGDGEGQFDHPAPIDIDPQGNIYIIDYNNYRIQKFDSDFNYITQWGQEGSGDDEFGEPEDLTIDGSGNVYVSDSDAGKIKKFTPSGAGDEFTIDPHGSVSVSYLNVTGSNNVSGTTITCTNCTDGGGNTGWTFPSATHNSGHHGSSGGGGGGSSRPPTTPTTPTTPGVNPPGCLSGYIFSTTTGQRCSSTTFPNTPTTPTSQFTFTQNLTLGSTGPEVKQLQIFLNSHGFPVANTGVGSPGQESNYFGNLTKLALSKYQQANGITPSVGYFGPITRGYVNSH